MPVVWHSFEWKTVKSDSKKKISKKNELEKKESPYEEQEKNGEIPSVDADDSAKPTDEIEETEAANPIKPKTENGLKPKTSSKTEAEETSPDST